MPWCEPCDQYLAPSAVNVDGTCTTCGAEVDATTKVQKAPGIPWHFWLVLIAAAFYIGWRAIEGAIWLINQL